MHTLSGKELMKKVGLWVGLVLATIVFFALATTTLLYFKLGETVAIGVPEIIVLYFWGGYLLRKHSWRKIVGTALFSLAVVLNLIFVSSPYDTAEEFRETRIFLLPLFLSGIFLVMQKGKLSRLMGVLVIILTIVGALWGATFQFANLHNLNSGI